MAETGGTFKLSDKLTLIFNDSPEYISYTGTIPEVEYDSQDKPMPNSAKESNRTQITTHTIIVDETGKEIEKTTEHNYLAVEQPTGTMLAYLGMESEERGRRKALKKDNYVLYAAIASAGLSLVTILLVLGLTEQFDTLSGLPALIKASCSNTVIN
ncbi:hypothetical protein GQ473_02515 [archaeon]|nr:hypothetical protein [archaeon]